MATDLEVAFVRAGFENYFVALQTTARFATMVQDRLVDAFTSSETWQSWAVAPAAQPRRSSGSQRTPWLGVTQQVTLTSGDAADLVLGVWWRAKDTVVYTHFSTGPEWALRRQPVDSAVFRREKNRARRVMLAVQRGNDTAIILGCVAARIIKNGPIPRLQVAEVVAVAAVRDTQRQRRHGKRDG